MTETPSLDRLTATLGIAVPAIAGARRRSNETISRLAGGLGNTIPVDASFVVFGSLARGELTAGSDLDWTLLVDGQAYASHRDDARKIEKHIQELGLSEPGQEGTFGGLAFSHDLVHYIGGGDDTNRNTTRRILLLLESRPIGQSDAYVRVLKQLFKRYIEEDFGYVHGTNPYGLPRFLQNDIARYWRTVAVDFAYKRRERQAKGWALRTVKLRLSRKLTYVAGLVACYSCSSDIEGESATRPIPDLIDHLQRFVRRPALEIIAEALLRYVDQAPIAEAASRLLVAYDRFLALLHDEVSRTRLETLSPEEASSDSLYGHARGIGHDFQEALNTIFVDPNGTHLYRLTRIYGVF